MEQPEFNLSDFVVSTKANYQKEEQPKIKGAKKSPYQVKVDFKKQVITFSKTIAEQIGLEFNSLAHAVSPKGTIALVVVPGNEGLFGKSIARGKSKGLHFKNRKFTEDLASLNLTSGTYNLTKIGTAPAKIRTKVVDNCDYYMVEMYGEPKDLSLPDVAEQLKMENPYKLEDVPAPTTSSEEDLKF